MGWEDNGSKWGSCVCGGVCVGGEGNLLSKFMMILKFDNFANFTKGVKLINVIYMNIWKI